MRGTRTRDVQMHLTCDTCGSHTETCGCASFIPKRERVLAALAEHPAMSDRAIAEMVGVSAMAVNRARKSTVTGVTVEDTKTKRTGKDGKERKMPQRAPAKEEKPDPNSVLVAAYGLMELADKAAKEVNALLATDMKKATTPPMVNAVKAIIAAWTAVLDQIGDPNA
jgi:winged helix-turn-helix DNA-binding protein